MTREDWNLSSLDQDWPEIPQELVSLDHAQVQAEFEVEAEPVQASAEIVDVQATESSTVAETDAEYEARKNRNWDSYFKVCQQHKLDGGRIDQLIILENVDRFRNSPVRIEVIKEVFGCEDTYIEELIARVEDRKRTTPTVERVLNPEVVAEAVAATRDQRGYADKVNCLLERTMNNGHLRWNDLLQQIEYRGEALQEHFANAPHLWLKRLFPDMPVGDKNTAYDCLLLVAKMWRYHPVEFYLNSVADDPSIESLDLQQTMRDILGFPPDDHLSPVLVSKWLVGAASRILFEGSEFSQMLILSNTEEGLGKSSFLSYLAGPGFYSDSATSVDLSNAVELLRILHRNFINEVSEVDEWFKPKFNSKLKQLIKPEPDQMRDLWGKVPVTRPRKFANVGTTNKTRGELFTSGEQNRRFWVVEPLGTLETVSESGESRFHIDRDKARDLRDRIWATAVREMREQGKAAFTLTVDEDMASRARNLEYNSFDLASDDLGAFLSKFQVSSISLEDIAIQFLKVKHVRSVSKELVNIMALHGYKKKQNIKYRGRVARTVYVYGGDEERNEEFKSSMLLQWEGHTF